MLRDLPVDRPILAQRYMKPDGLDYKIFNIGGQLFGIKRVWPLRTYEDKVGELFTLTPELEDIALRCGQAFWHRFIRHGYHLQQRRTLRGGCQ